MIIFTFSKDCTRYGTFRSPDKLARQKKLAKALGLSYHEKQICVSKKECIKDVTIIYKCLIEIYFILCATNMALN